MTEAPVLRLDVSAVPVEIRDRALVGLDFLGTSLGVRMVLVGSAEADLRYGGPKRDDGSVWLPFWPEAYEPATRFCHASIDGLPHWLPESRPNVGPTDLIGSTWRLLALLDETQVAEADRDDAGAFLTHALPDARREVLDEPLAEWHAMALRAHLESNGVGLGDRMRRWPGGKAYAALVTHDADGPRLQHPTELAKALAKAILRRSRSEGQAFVEGLSTKLRGRPDPYFAFDGWAAAERALGIRSAFYLYVRSSVPRHPRDPVYAIDRHPRWDVLRRLAEDGWELGVHAGMRAASGAHGLREERQRLEALTGVRPIGVRHHYWRLDWRSPARTFVRQLEAGYEHDASMAWRDRPGLRAGTSLPYFVPDVDGAGPLRLLELPTTVMDGHLFEYLGLHDEAAAAAAERLRLRIDRAGGVFNIDWHERAFCDRFSYRGWATIGLALMRSVAADAWVTTPTELARWWRSRARSVGLPEIRPA